MADGLTGLGFGLVIGLMVAVLIGVHIDGWLVLAACAVMGAGR